MACLGDDLLVFGRCLTGLVHRQSYADRRARTGSALELNVSSMAANVALADAESQAGAFAALGGEERLEDMRQDIGGNSAPGVAHSQFNNAGRLLQSSRDRDAAARRSGLGSVQ